MIFLRKRYSDTVTSQLIIRAAKTVNSLGGDAVITSSFRTLNAFPWDTSSR